MSYYEDDWENLAEVHPTLRIVIGILLISIVNLIAVFIWPVWVDFIDTLNNVVNTLPPSLTNGDIKVSSTNFALLSISLEAAFVITFSGIIVFYVIVPAFKKESP